MDDLAVLSDERHEIGDCSERSNIQIIGIEALFLDLPQRLHEFERDADARKILVRVGTVRAVRVDDCIGGRQDTARQMVVGDDDVHRPIHLRHNIHR